MPHHHSPAIACSALLLVLSPTAPGQHLIDEIHGESARDKMGCSVTSLSDVNGDGVPDFAVGVPGEDNAGVDSGSVEVRSGFTRTLLRRVDGQQGGDLFGWALDTLSDLNGDQVAELLVGGPSHDSSDGRDVGMVQIVDPVSGMQIRTHLGSDPGGSFGRAVSKAGDLDGDGVEDYLVGAPFNNTGGTDRGAVFGYSGSDGSLLYSIIGNGGEFGTSVSDLDDVNGDGHDDFLVGERIRSAYNTGAVHLFSGSDAAPIHVWVGSHGEQLGTAVLGVPDYDGDGLADVLAGAPRAAPNGADSGRAVLFSSGQLGTSLSVLPGQFVDEYHGSSLALSDVNGDGVLDYLIGSPVLGNVPQAPGRLRMYSGKGHWQFFELQGAPQGEAFGRAVTGAGDLDGDGLGDVLVGDWLEDEPGRPDAGSVRVFGGGELFLDASPRTFINGQVVEVRVGDGPPGSPFLLVLAEANGIPVNRPILSARFNLSGGWSAQVTTSLPADQTLCIIAHALVSGTILASNTVQMQSE